MVRNFTASVPRDLYDEGTINVTEEVGMARHANPGNFANDPKRASEAGKKGGRMSGGNFKNDREKASKAGKKGGSK